MKHKISLVLDTAHQQKVTNKHNMKLKLEAIGATLWVVVVVVVTP